MRIHCSPEDIAGDKIILKNQAQIHHLTAVMRFKTGDTVFVFDGQYQEYQCRIETLTQDKVELIILNRKTASTHTPNIALACAIPKKVKIDYIIEKATELGIERIIPLNTRRTIVKVPADKSDDKLKRWVSIAKEASKQCGRIKFPRIDPVTQFKDLLPEIKEYDLAIIPNLEPGNKNINTVINNFSREAGSRNAGKGKSILVCIGPEGDFTLPEIQAAREEGCIGVSLGDLTLKVDTAAIAVVAFIRFLGI